MIRCELCRECTILLVLILKLKRKYLVCGSVKVVIRNMDPTEIKSLLCKFS